MLNDEPLPHVLELRNVSYTSTLSNDSICSRLFSPAQVVRLLSDVSIEVVSGEVHALVGPSDSGRDVLLEVISGSASGGTAGSVQLNNYALCRKRFNKLCSFVSGRQRFPRFLTVHSMLYYTARLMFDDSLPTAVLDKRLHSLMREFDLLCYSHEQLQNLSPSARRRALLANALVKDPLLVIVDDPCHGLEPIACYQLLYCLRSYAAEHNRIVLISITNPRSDLCQLISSITLLFRGEVMYSGRLSMATVYFGEAGLPCPANENPATYYLTKATLNFETKATHDQTLSEALRLVELFKSNSAPTLPRRLSQLMLGGDDTVALCFLRRPSVGVKLLVLIRRSFTAICSSQSQLLFRIACFPVFMLLLSLFSTNLLNGAWTSPHTAARILELALLIVYSVSTLLAITSYDELMSLSVVERFEGLYSKSLSGFAYCCTAVAIDSASIFMGTAALLWLSNITWSMAIVNSSIVFLCVYFCAHVVTITSMLFVRDNTNNFLISLLVIIAWFLFGGGFLRSLSTVPFDGLLFLFYANPIRAADVILSLEIFSQLPVRNCVRHEQNGVDATSYENFCRWTNGSMYVEESLPAATLQSQDQWTNLLLLALIVTVLLLLSIALHALPQPRQVVDKFRFV
ncbi:unnamed protein product [Nippostrongylus brasiliensis]|uniref:ABC transporter domain-containing protein n=1 Tax=Nippostrongylus brasiliensis TaxID=27835 RepID=A0A0N4YE83_NIPBR|nr:hypothetical protein Q1695_011283 [Nippostrongylus brasiliensis]VDL78578.1 unnamed protein product [Nippostrongylus brasiliensis]